VEAARWQYVSALQHNTAQCGGGGDGEGSGNNIGIGVSGASNGPTGEGKKVYSTWKKKKSNPTINRR